MTEKEELEARIENHDKARRFGRETVWQLQAEITKERRNHKQRIKVLLEQIRKENSMLRTYAKEVSWAKKRLKRLMQIPGEHRRWAKRNPGMVFEAMTIEALHQKPRTDGKEGEEK